MISFSFFGQKNLNNYKYVVVANKFDFLKKADQYQTSSLTKFLFNKYGYTSFLDIDKLPDELISDKCLSLYAAVNNESTMFTTKVNLILKDCNDRIVYKSAVGKSKEKDYKKTYHEAIRNAFKDPKINNYSFKPTPKKNSIPKATPVVKTIVTKKPLIDNSIKETKVVANNILYAQAIHNGFQLVDTTPKVIFRILKSNQENVFIIENKNGILYKKGSKWLAEFYENSVLIQKEYQINF